MPADRCWLRMIFDGRYKYVLAENYRPMLYDLATDRDEFDDRGPIQHSPTCAPAWRQPFSPGRADHANA